ncbi:helix-hairpin-helix domain-containing protein [Flagellimonas hymeniacidonis]|uniref:Helix-hairpin-helix domain-containing protein n=1 Tax=Flagellimonas hymeniacidonis TaxID=2603628 RepID=A0A5C8V7F9_9FLAO|nr:helix-hairpin-helix domain-containing protein [Flagellimonas hymeniacidonis]TXN36728.1 helix-hairpin-helix domain-containing protein [Flagellimonas hymeniacidonis]
MNNFKSHFKFNKQERSGIFFLLLIIVVLQGVHLFIKAKPYDTESKIAVNTLVQSKLDSLKKSALQKEELKTFSFNPNYISDYKGYTLGISPEALDRLFAFREQGKFVNSAEEFQQVTKISDSLLKVIAPLFKFPKWKQKAKYASSYSNNSTKKKTIQVADINSATEEDLKTISGIGEKLSSRIIKFRDRLGGFLEDEQLYDVYGLDVEVVERALNKFKVLNPPKVEKININKASVEEMSRLVYINRKLAQEIVKHREMHGRYKSLDELKHVPTFPLDRIARIKLYLTL